MSVDIQLGFELKLDAQKFKMMTITHNEELNQRIQNGIDEAIEHLCKEGVVENLVKQQVINDIQNSIGNFGFKYRLKETANDIITKKLQDGVEKYSDKIVAATMKAIEESKF